MIKQLYLAGNKPHWPLYSHAHPPALLVCWICNLINRPCSAMTWSFIESEKQMSRIRVPLIIGKACYCYRLKGLINKANTNFWRQQTWVKMSQWSDHIKNDPISPSTLSIDCSVEVVNNTLLNWIWMKLIFLSKVETIWFTLNLCLIPLVLHGSAS